MTILKDLNSNNYIHQLVIFFSASKDKETLDLAYEAGCDGFMEKPLQMELFENMYMQHLTKSE